MTLQQQRSDVGLATALRISVSRLARRLRVERLVPELAEPALSDTQLAAPATLERHGAMSPRGLAEDEKGEPPSITRRLAAPGDWQRVAPAAPPPDRRQVTLTVTPGGRELVQKVRRRREAWLARRLAELSPQERATLRAAAPILEKLSQS